MPRHTTEGMRPTFFASRAALRRWFKQHHATAQEVVIGFYSRAPPSAA